MGMQKIKKKIIWEYNSICDGSFLSVLDSAQCLTASSCGFSDQNLPQDVYHTHNILLL